MASAVNTPLWAIEGSPQTASMPPAVDERVALLRTVCSLIGERKLCHFIRIRSAPSNFIAYVSLAKIFVKSVWNCERSHPLADKIRLQSYLGDQYTRNCNVTLSAFYALIQLCQFNFFKIVGSFFSTWCAYKGREWNTISIVVDCLMLGNDIYSPTLDLTRISIEDARIIFNLPRTYTELEVRNRHNAISHNMTTLYAEHHDLLADRNKREIIKNLVDEAIQTIFAYHHWILHV